LIETENRAELAPEFARALRHLGDIYSESGRNDEAAQPHGETLAIYRRLVDLEKRDEFARDFADLLVSQGNALWRTGAYEEAATTLDQAAELYRRLFQQDGHSDVAHALANALNSQGLAHMESGLAAPARRCWEEGLALYDDLIDGQGRKELSESRGYILMNECYCLNSFHRFTEALPWGQRAVAAYRPLVEQGRTELTDLLSSALDNLGDTLNGLGRPAEAMVLLDEALALRSRWVEELGHQEAARNLAWTWTSRGSACAALGQSGEALASFARAVAICEKLIHDGKGLEIARDFARTLLAQAQTLDRLGKPEAAGACYRRAFDLLRPLVEAGKSYMLPACLAGVRHWFELLCRQGSWSEAATVLAWACRQTAPVLASKSPPELLRDEFNELLSLVQKLPADQRLALDTALGHDKELLR
jgi:tetratricopeptide (TPR) repeat protein